MQHAISWLPTLFLRLCRAFGFGVAMDPPREFTSSIRIYRPQLGECPLCGEELMECDCQWSVHAMSRTIRLPFPPSANRIWRHVVIGRSARVLLSRDGREYRELVAAEVQRQCPWIKSPLPLSERLRVTMVCVMPDRRKRDLGNLEKASMDALTHAGVWSDDAQIDDLRLVRWKVESPGWLEVTIERIESAQRSLL